MEDFKIVIEEKREFKNIYAIFHNFFCHIRHFTNQKQRKNKGTKGKLLGLRQGLHKKQTHLKHSHRNKRLISGKRECLIEVKQLSRKSKTYVPRKSQFKLTNFFGAPKEIKIHISSAKKRNVIVWHQKLFEH